MLLAFSAAVCLILLLIVAGTANSNSTPLFLFAALSAFGAFTVGAGTVHLIYRAFGEKQ
jgi:hypothetical protein